MSSDRAVRLAMLLLLAPCATGCPRWAYREVGLLGDPAAQSVRDSSKRTFISGVVLRRCSLTDKPVSEVRVELYRGTRGEPIGSTATGIDGRFALRSEYLADTDGDFYLHVQKLWLRLPNDADGTYDAHLLLPCDEAPAAVPQFDAEGIRARPAPGSLATPTSSTSDAAAF